MRDKLNRHRPLNITNFQMRWKSFSIGVCFPYIVEELRKHPSVEEGGKYIGYVYKPGELTLQKFDVNARAQAIVITDFLPSGPKAVRTAAESCPMVTIKKFSFAELRNSMPQSNMLALGIAIIVTGYKHLVLETRKDLSNG